MKLFALFCAFALCTSSAWAAPGPILDKPFLAWQCEAPPAKAPAQVTLYFFDPSISVDRYSDAGFDRVDGISTVAHAVGPEGETSEITFGTFRRDNLGYEIAMRFSLRPSKNGPRPVIFPESAPLTIIDRISGEMRARDAEPGTSEITCRTVQGAFREVAQDYYLMLLLLSVPKG